MSKLSTRLVGFVIEINPPIENNRVTGFFDSDEFKDEIFDIGTSEIEMMPHSGSYYITFQNISVDEAISKVAECKKIALKHLQLNG